MKKMIKKELEAMLYDKKIIESELKNMILNYEDYENGYVDTIYQFIIENAIFYVACFDEIEGLDLIIDYLEDEGDEAWFIQILEETDNYVIDGKGDKYYDDEYVIGGNHGRYLYHGGNFRIEELNI